MGIVLSRLGENKCSVCEGTGKYPSYMDCGECHGTGYSYSIRRSLYHIKENAREKYINYKL